MRIKEMRLGFVQFESLAGLLGSKTAPAIPFGFLLDSGKFKAQFDLALKKSGDCRVPWHTGYGRRFWSSYIKKESPSLTDYWNLMVPLQYKLEPVLTAPWLNGNARARAYLYPWGIGALVDMSITAAMDIDDAVNRLVSILNTDQMEITLNGTPQQGSLPVLLQSFSNY